MKGVGKFMVNGTRIKCLFACVVYVLAKPWSSLERQTVMKQLGFLIQMIRAPQKNECLNAIAAEPCLSNRDWRSVKNHLASIIRYARLRDQRN